MSDQLTLDEVLAARGDGMRRAEEGAGKWDCSVIDQAILAAAGTGQPFSANDIRDRLPEVRRPAVGARFNALRQRGLIQIVGEVRSTDVGTHGKKIGLYVGRVA